MADESISVALTDDGTIEEITGLLEIFGVNAETAAQRAVGAFTNVSKSQDAAANSAKLLAAAEAAGVTALDSVALAVSKLTTNELALAAADDQLTATVQRLTVAQTDSVASAVAMARAEQDIVAQLGAAGDAAGAAAVKFGAVAKATQDISAVTAGMNIAERETVAILTQLGVGAADAGSRMEAGYTSGANAAQRLATETAVLAQATKAGYLDVDSLSQAVSKLTQSELVAISNTEGMARVFGLLQEAVTANNSAFAANAVAVEQETGTFSAAANRADALAAALERLKDFMAADVANAEALATSTDRVSASMTKAEAAMTAAVAAGAKLAFAEDAAAVSATGLSVKMAAVQEAGVKVGATFGGLNAVFASAFVATEITHAYDEFVKLQASLKLVTSSAGEAASVYGQLKDVANATQTPLESNVKTFVQFSEAGKAAGLTATQIVGAVQGIGVALKLSGTSGQQATAAMRSLTEVFETTDGSATRFFQNLRRESPVTYALIQQSAQKLGISLSEFGGETSSTADKLEKLGEKLTEQKSKLDGTQGSVSGLTSKYTAQSAETTKLRGELDKLVASGDTSSAKFNQLRSAISSSTIQTQQFAAQLNVAKTAEDQHAQAQVNATQKQITAASATADATKKQRDFAAILNDVGVSNIAAAKGFDTLGGAITVLKNNLIDFAGNSTTASATVTVLKDAVYLTAVNLNTIIPLVLALGAAVATVKVAQLAYDLAQLAKTVALLSFNPIVVGIGLAVGAFYVFSQIVEKVTSYLSDGKNTVDLFGRFLDGLGGIAATTGNVMSILSGKLADTASKTTAAAAVTQDLTKKTEDTTGALYNQIAGSTTAGQTMDQYKVKLKAYNDEMDRRYRAEQTATQSTTDLSGKTVTATAAVNDNATALNTQATNAGKAADATTKAGTAAANSVGFWSGLTNAIKGAYNALLDYIAKAAGLGSLGGAGSPAVPAARDGGSFHVPGGSGVDSKLIAVSPGEVVTVQTPAQYASGVAPHKTAGQTHFATGGVTTGAGVNLGQSVSLTAGRPTAATSVSGFSETRQGPQAITQATTQLSSQVANNSAATTANTAATTAAAANDNSLSAAVSALSTQVQSNTTAVNSSTQAVNANTQGMTQLTAANSSLVSTVSNAVTSIQAAAASVGAAKAAAAATQASVPSVEPVSAVASAPAASVAQQRYTDAVNAHTTLQNSYTRSSGLLPGGGSVSASSSGGSSIVDSLGRDAAGNTVGDTSYQDIINQVRAYDNGSGYNTSKVKGGTSYDNTKLTARDGADFHIPGGTGVDSKIVKLAVSPGETVGVRTPAQRAAERGNAGGNSQQIAFNISTPDVGSFRASQDQLASKALRGMRRLGRRG